MLSFLLHGPKLGPWYDFLLKYRSAPPVSRELLLIETEHMKLSEPALQDAIVEPSILASALIAMIELDAAALAIQSPVLGLSPGGGRDEADVRLRFDEEFALLDRNIRNLFEAIRVGSIAPSDSDRYVEELVNLTGQGKDRLSAAVTGHDGEAMGRFEKTAKAFGHLQRGSYAQVRPDWDGKIRRIAPVLPDGAGQVIYNLFQDCYRGFGIEDSGEGPALRDTALAREVLVLLDKGGGLLIDTRLRKEDLRRLALNHFSEYDKEDQTLRRLLEEAEKLGIYNDLEPEDYPSLRYDYAVSLREDMLEDPAPAMKSRWVQARNAYLSRLEDFLFSPAETTMVNGYEELIASGEIDEEGILRLTALRDELIRVFAVLRNQYQHIVVIRNNLETALASSICILGGQADLEISAVFANTLLSGNFIIPEADRLVLLFSLGSALFCLLCIRRRGPLLSLGMGLFLSVLALFGFSCRFVITASWLEPLIPAGTTAAASLSSSLCALVMKRRFIQRFRTAYGSCVTKSRLNALIRAGKPLPEEALVSLAAIVAVRNSALMSREDREQPSAAFAAVQVFRETAVRLFLEAGGTIVGSAGDLILAAFGSPLEEQEKNGDLLSSAGLVHKAAELVAHFQKTANIPDGDSWRFGIDTGDCAFTWSRISGYGAFGHPVVRARILAGLSSRYKTRVLISQTASEGVEGLKLRRLDTLGERDGTGRESFYEMVGLDGVSWSVDF